MNYLGKIVSNVRDMYKQINPTNMSGAVDVIVVHQPDNTLVCSPFHVKFGKLEVLRACNKNVDICVDDSLCEIRMLLSESGEAYFSKLEGPCNCEACIISSLSAFLKPKSINYRSRGLSDSEAYESHEIEKINLFSDNEELRSERVHKFNIMDSPISIDQGMDVEEENDQLPSVTPPSSFMIDSYTPQDSSLSTTNVTPEKSSKPFQQAGLSKLIPFNSPDHTVVLSLCGNLYSSAKKPEHFDDCIVSFDQYTADFGILLNPKLVVKLDNRYYNWAVASPIIMSYLCFQASIPPERFLQLKRTYMPKNKGWFIWRRKKESESTGDEETPAPSALKEIKSEQTIMPSSKVDSNLVHSLNDANSTADNISGKKRQPLRPSNNQNPLGSQNQLDLFSEKCYYKRITLTSDELKSLNLKYGQNYVKYSVTSRYQGTVECVARIFLWDHRDKIVISDVDGTITKSDVLGMMLPLMGKDWTQKGVAKLFSLIVKNGYKILYLSARNIGISVRTRLHLENILQDKLGLPDGPILLSPTSLFESLHREVIERKPEIFKISCLKYIMSLFPADDFPFVAGFGNRPNDSIAYKALNIPLPKIFQINYRGQIMQQSSQSYLTSYSNLAEFVDYIFPLCSESKPLVPDQHLHNDFFYWMRPF